jgi:hypothetical protein
MGLLRRTPVPLAEPCDRCGAPGIARYARRGVLCLDDQGAEVKTVDLVACEFHANLNGAELARQGFVLIQVAS